MAKGYLQIKVDADLESAFAQALEPQLANGWRRDRQWEERVRPRAANKQLYFYRRAAAPGRPACGLCLYRLDSETLQVRNIIPNESGEFTDAEYNEIQRDFQKQVEKTGCPSLVTGEKPVLILTGRVQGKFERFLFNANPTTGNVHPVDRRNWMEFLLAAHTDRCLPQTDQFEEYMIDVLKWDGAVVNRMALELEFAKGLLALDRETGSRK